MDTSDPCNIDMENVIIDIYDVIGGIVPYPQWNYPEAYKTGTVRMVNIKFVTSRDRTYESGANLIFLSTAGDNYLENIDFYDVYHISNIPTANFISMMTEACNPEDLENRYVTMNNFNISLKNPDYDPGRVSPIVIINLIDTYVSIPSHF